MSHGFGWRPGFFSPDIDSKLIEETAVTLMGEICTRNFLGSLDD